MLLSNAEMTKQLQNVVSFPWGTLFVRIKIIGTHIQLTCLIFTIMSNLQAILTSWMHRSQSLPSYWDDQLKFLIRYGFPIDFNNEILLSSEENNHSSATEFPDHVRKYFHDEGRLGQF